jgi:hypothetical protein
MASENETPLTEKVKQWRSHHFSLVRPGDLSGDVSGLLRKVADSLDELGQIEVQDIAFCVQNRGSEIECQATVYFTFPNE